jgi:hypothetical protein
MRITSQRFGVSHRVKVGFQDIVDAVETLEFSKKLVAEVQAPGVGPDKILDWSRAELEEARAATDQSEVQRKAVTATILAKTGVECLLDWYLRSSFIEFTIRNHAGTHEKLEALDAEGSLSVGLSLFHDVLFEPRNRVIHEYARVDLRTATHAYELARLFVQGAKGVRDPRVSAVYYGTLDVAEGDEARQLSGLKKPVKDGNDIFYFGGSVRWGVMASFFAVATCHQCQCWNRRETGHLRSGMHL